MAEPREIKALFTLIDDPDEEVYFTVQERLMSFGNIIIPNLENLWENTVSEEVQLRIEMIIYQIQYRDLTEEFITWKDGGAELLFGALLVAKYQYPDMQSITALQEIEKIRRNIWIEMNSYLTPMEQVKIMDSILYNYYKMRGGEIAYAKPNEFMLHLTLESKKGNAITTGVLYQVLCEMLDIPLRIISIPQQFLLGYFDPQLAFKSQGGHPSEKIKFFVDPSNGAAHSHQDIENYFKRIAVPPTPSYFKPMTNKRIIQLMLEELGKCFDDVKNEYKRIDLMKLSQMLDD